MKKVILVSLLLFNALFMDAQIIFQKTYGAGYAYDMHKTSDGGYVMGGTAPTAKLGASYVIKIDANGDTLWTRTYTDTCGSSSLTNGQYINDIVQNMDHGYLTCGGKGAVCGNSTIGGNIARLDSNGNVLWAKYCSTSEDPYPCIQDKAGNFIVGGYETGLGAGAEDGCMMKLDKNGDTIWSRTYGGSGNDWFNHILQTKDGGYLAAGYTYSFGAGNQDIYLVKVDSNGKLMWSKTYGTSYSEYVFGHGMQPTSDGGYILTGQITMGSSSRQTFLTKIDSAGNLKWAKCYYGSYGHAVHQTPDGGYAVGGVKLGEGVELIKTDSTGIVQWCKLYTANGQTGAGFNGFFMELANDGGYALGGQTIITPHIKTPYFIKTDANGNTFCFDSTIVIADSVLAFTVTNPATQVFQGANTVSYPVFLFSEGQVSALCVETGLKEINNTTENSSIYPNPAVTSATILFSDASIRTIDVFDVAGRKIGSYMSANKEYTFSCGKLSTGVYFIKIISGKSIETLKFVKQ